HLKGIVSAPPFGEAAHGLHHVLATRVNGVSRAKLLGVPQLVLHQVYGDDCARASEGAPLDHVQAYAATADHHRAAARLDLGSVDCRADAGHDAATHQARLVERHVVRNRDARYLGHHCVLGEAGEPSHVMDILTVLLKPAGAVEQRALTHSDAHVLA